MMDRDRSVLDVRSRCSSSFGDAAAAAGVEVEARGEAAPAIDSGARETSMTFYDAGPPPPEASAFAEASADRRSLGGGWSARLFRSNRATIGPWDSGLQHGGPPAALLGLHLEALAASNQARIARLSYDFLSPVPVADLAVTTEVIRPGARIQLSSAVLRTADRPVLRGTAWHVTAEQGRSTPVTNEFVVPRIPDTETRNYFPGVGSFPYAEAIEWRFVTGGFDQLGPATVWTRCRIPVLDGVPLSGLQRLLVVVDAANGISASLPITSWTFVPIDLTVVLERHPIDEWVGMSSVTTIGTDGIGFSETTLFDVRGAIGRALQTLFVAPRDESVSTSASGQASGADNAGRRRASRKGSTRAGRPRF